MERSRQAHGWIVEISKSSKADLMVFPDCDPWLKNALRTQHLLIQGKMIDPAGWQKHAEVVQKSVLGFMLKAAHYDESS
jgi:hypothetical protein